MRVLCILSDLVGGVLHSVGGVIHSQLLGGVIHSQLVNVGGV